jgi:very-short-patch-repair endonuclease
MQIKKFSIGQSCSKCKYKTEHKLYNILKDYYPSIIREFKAEWCKNKNYLPFDYVLEDYKIIIELDGPQHFIQISNWKSPYETQQTDKYKILCANNNGYSVIRLLQEDVLYNKYDWHNELLNNIIHIRNNNHIVNIYMAKDKIYDGYK